MRTILKIGNTRLQKLVVCLLLLFIFTACGINKSIHHRPDLSNYNSVINKRKKVNDSTYFIDDNFLTKNKYGQWEMYVSGDPLELGLKTGKLTQELFNFQEQVFLNKIWELVPSQSKRKLLTKFVHWYNRKMFTHIPNAYKAEIYGISQYADPAYNDFADPYLRVLYMHGAHDIGHALQDLALVGCSSFAVWGDKTPDGQMLLGRNFDFYAGDAFAKNKIIAFIAPDKGYKYLSVTWGGMIGVLSGMNEKGLTVTINAGKSKIPLIAKTPISLVSREILQHASTLNEAIAIAKKREVFVSESIMVSSAIDNKVVLIEVSPKNFGVYDVSNSDQLICTNHFQSNAYANDARNLKTIAQSHTQYRYMRLEELINQNEVITPQKAAAILRNKKGLNDTILGYGNEKALNQLHAHHGIIFKPQQKQVWVSSNPYQLGEFVAYDLDEVFKNRKGNPLSHSLAQEKNKIARDSFIDSPDFKNYQKYRLLEQEVDQAIENNKTLNSKLLLNLTQKNPNYWKSYFLKGKYYYNQGYYAAALIEFKKANKRVVTTVPDQRLLAQYIKKSTRKINR